MIFIIDPACPFRHGCPETYIVTGLRSRTIVPGQQYTHGASGLCGAANHSLDEGDIQQIGVDDLG